MAYFQQMLKAPDLVKNKDLLGRASGALAALLAQVAGIELKGVESLEPEPHVGIDMLARLTVRGRLHTLACEVRPNGQPRHARTALLQLRNYAVHHSHGTTPVLVAPYLSPETRALCREQAVGYLDLEGNARLVFAGIFIERIVVDHQPVGERRELKSLFKSKSAQVLRVMLGDPDTPWRVTELASVANVSLGHVSNVRSALLDREWARVSPKGLQLSEPAVLLDSWRDMYEPPAGERMRFYTPLHGSALEEAALETLRSKTFEGAAAFASFSAANWLAPYGRTGTHYFYADEEGLEQIRMPLKLTPVSKGENIVVTLPRDRGVFFGTEEPEPGAICTSPIQTYLDLSASGERGREAADHLRRERLKWTK